MEIFNSFGSYFKSWGNRFTKSYKKETPLKENSKDLGFNLYYILLHLATLIMVPVVIVTETVTLVSNLIVVVSKFIYTYIIKWPYENVFKRAWNWIINLFKGKDKDVDPIDPEKNNLSIHKDDGDIENIVPAT